MKGSVISQIGEGLRFETEVSDLPVPEVNLIEDIYDRDFFGHRHFTFIRKESKNTQKIEIQSSHLASKKTESAILKYFQQKYSGSEIYSVINDKIIPRIHNIEKNHPQNNRKCFKISIIYSKANQQTPPEMFQNTKTSPEFEKFLNILGEKINVEKHTGYKGDVKLGEAYYTKWRDCEIIFHVAVNMNSEGHRRLIGNDVAHIFFQEEGKFQPQNVDQLGTVPHVFMVVQPQKNKFSLASFCRVNVGEYKPNMPKDYSFPKNELKDFLLSKIINGYATAMLCPPMNRLFFVPRGHTIEQISKDFPAETKSDIKFREKQEIEKRLVQRKKSDKMEVKVTVISARNLIPKDTGGQTDPYVELKLQEQQAKTTVLKRTLNPSWGEELFFQLGGIEEPYAELELSIWDYDRFTAHYLLGHVVILVSDVKKICQEEGGIEKIFQIEHPEKPHADLGEVSLRFSLTGSLKRSSNVGNGKTFRKHGGRIKSKDIADLDLGKYRFGKKKPIADSSGELRAILADFENKYNEEEEETIVKKEEDQPRPLSANLTNFSKDSLIRLLSVDPPSPSKSNTFGELQGMVNSLDIPGVDFYLDPDLCLYCGEKCTDHTHIKAFGKNYHPDHFRCTACDILLDQDNFLRGELDMPLCPNCPGVDNKICQICGETIVDTYVQLDSGYYQHKECRNPCYKCGKPIDGDEISALDRVYHEKCFTCFKCEKLLTKEFIDKDDELYCKKCGSVPCHFCDQPISGQSISFEDRDYHENCFRCYKCNEKLSVNIFYVIGNNLECDSCYSQ